jgi:hypothetical protein
LCAKEIRRDVMEQLKKEAPVLLCKLEKIFLMQDAAKIKEVSEGAVQGPGPFQGSSSSSIRRRELLSAVHGDEVTYLVQINLFTYLQINLELYVPG